MDAGSVVALGSLGAGIFGAVLVWLVKIEHRMTRLETTINERLPRGGSHAA
jgi:hypothetical protein